MLLDKIKLTLRIDDNNLDDEIQDIINAALADLKLSGIKNLIEDDPLIIKAIKTYCKAEFSTDDKEIERYLKSYELLKSHLCLTNEYI